MDDGNSSSDYYTLAQQVSLTIGTSLAAALSIAGSTAIVYVIYVDHRRKKASHNVKNRLLLGLCLSDILNSLVYVFWSLAIPKGTPSGKLAVFVLFVCAYVGNVDVMLRSYPEQILRRRNHSAMFCSTTATETKKTNYLLPPATPLVVE
jgi:hypothetical protein